MESAAEIPLRAWRDPLVNFRNGLIISAALRNAHVSLQAERPPLVVVPAVQHCANKLTHFRLREAIERGDVSAADPRALADELHTYIVGLVQEAKIANDVRVLDRLKPGAHRLLGLHIAPAAV